MFETNENKSKPALKNAKSKNKFKPHVFINHANKKKKIIYASIHI